MHSATVPTIGARRIARRTSPRATTLHWWARPHAFTFLFLIPLFTICALLPDEMFFSWKHGQNFLSPEAFTTGLSALVSFALAAQLAWRTGGRRGLAYGLQGDRLLARTQYRSIVYCILFVTLAAYVLLLGPALRNPNLATGLYGGGLHPSEVREKLDSIPGISSLVNLGPLYVTLLLLQRNLTGYRLTNFDKAAFSVFLIFVIARVFLWSERLAFLEILIPIAIIRVASMNRHRVLVGMLPFIGVITIAIFFGVTEYFRSWIHTYSGTGISFTEFVMTRLLGYYATAINNGALVFTTFDPLFVPYGTARWFFKLPLLSAPPLMDLTNLYGRTEIAFWSKANPELNNPSGIFAPLNDFGVIVGVAIWVLLGAFTGRLLRGFYKQKLMSMLLFPSWMTGVYELLRIFYWGDPRYFPILVIVPIIYWLLSRASIRRRGPVENMIRRHRAALRRMPSTLSTVAQRGDVPHLLR